MSDEAPKPPTGEHPATNVEVRRAFGWLSLQNVAVALGLVASLGVGGKQVLLWLMRDAIAQDGGVVVLEKRVTSLESAMGELRSGQSDLKTLMLRQAVDNAERANRQLEEGRANAEYLQTGRKPAILLQPLPAIPDGGR